MLNTTQINIFDTSTFENKINTYKSYYLDFWWSLDNKVTGLGNESNYWNRKIKERCTNNFINKFTTLLSNYPIEKPETDKYQRELESSLNEFINTVGIISIEDKQTLLDRGMLECTRDFFDEARLNFKDMEINDIGQAIRNLWIINIIQILMGKEIKLTPAAFGYSMLYPLTDNYLDDNTITLEEKRAINNRFEKRLRGEINNPECIHEISLFKMVEKIEDEFNRDKYPGVYNSLLGIHNAQKKSLLQQGQIHGIHERDVIGITFEKGGTSVLADAYLVNGELTEEESRFFFGYGVMLQICDDFQDIYKDFECNHTTMVSQLVNHYKLDNITNKLINFIIELTKGINCFNAENNEAIMRLIRKNCLELTFFTIAKNKKMYTKEYIRSIKKYFPYNMSYMNGLYKRMKRRGEEMEKIHGRDKLAGIIFTSLSSI